MRPERRATYRVQLRNGFTLDDAAGLASYLSGLGLSHLYCSPYLQAVPGSAHGYDVVNYDRVDPALGGEAALARLTEALREHGLSQVLDMVPNHMAIARENPWWWDVLENGPASRYASYFDVDWDPPEARHSNQVLAPVLGDHYGRVLEAGEIKLACERERFVVRYYDHVFPVDPRTLGRVLGPAAQRSRSDMLAYLAAGFDRLPEATAGDRSRARERFRDQAVLFDLLSRVQHERPEVAAAIGTAVDEINRDPDALDELLELQNYRLAFWRIAERELGYRRFFDITGLIGLTMEDEQVFADTHGQVLSWLETGVLDGLRIDHPDGLRDPEGYLHRLRRAEPDAWLLVEKILELGEDLPGTWPVAGTTGYDFIRRVNGLFVDPEAEEPLTRFYAFFTGANTDYQAVVHEKKRQVMNEVLGSDVNRLTALFLQVSERHRRHRDYTRNALREALTEVAAALHVYRTYVRADAQTAAGQVSEHDIRYLTEAVEAAKTHRPDLDPALLEFLRDLLLLRVPGDLEAELAMRFQQFTGPVMAKGVEDTTFYVYNRLVSLNEVGGDPGQFGVSVEAFHQASLEAQARWPQAMLATSTHDTKRSGDVRARLNVLSELPQEWSEAVMRWAANNERYRTDGQPDRNDEYLLYQTLVGAWPIEMERVLQYMEKAVREAKVHSSWTNQNEDYEAAVAAFVQGVLGDANFRADLEAFVDRVRPAGRLNALAQTLLKLTTPGVPDIYQGTELWDLSLVDPDNRRPVDYALRQRLLAELQDAAPESVLARMDEGLPKLWMICQALALRRRRPRPFGPEGSYEPLPVQGNHALAFARGGEVITVVPRLVARLDDNWGGTAVELPSGAWRNTFTGDTVEGGRALPLADLLRRFPVALLERV